MTAAPERFQPRVGDIVKHRDGALSRVTTTGGGVLSVVFLAPPHADMAITADDVKIHEPYPGRYRDPAARLRAIKFLMAQGRHGWDAYDGPTPDECDWMPQRDLDARADEAADRYETERERCQP